MSVMVSDDRGELMNDLCRYALSLATTIMFWMVVKKPSSAIKSRVKASRSWS